MDTRLDLVTSADGIEPRRPRRRAPQRTPPKRKARELAKHLRGERPDYAYLKEVFRHLRAELDVEVQRATQDAALRPHPGRDPPLLPDRLASPP